MKIRTFPRFLVAGLAIGLLSACGSNSSTASTEANLGTSSTEATPGTSSGNTASDQTASINSSGGSNSTVAVAPVTLQVFAGPGIKFDLPEYNTTAGVVKVTYENRDSQRHTLAFVDSDGTALPGEIEVVKSGSVGELEFTFQPGTYKVICTVPGHQAMRANLTVS